MDPIPGRYLTVLGAQCLGRFKVDYDALVRRVLTVAWSTDTQPHLLHGRGILEGAEEAQSKHLGDAGAPPLVEGGLDHPVVQEPHRHADVGGFRAGGGLGDPLSISTTYVQARTGKPKLAVFATDSVGRGLQRIHSAQKKTTILQKNRIRGDMVFHLSVTNVQLF